MEHFRSVFRRSWDGTWKDFFAAPVVTVVLLVLVWAVNLLLQYGKRGFMMNATAAGIGWSLLSTAIVFAAWLLIHFCYLTPKQMLAEAMVEIENAKQKEERLEKERNNLISANAPALIGTIETVGTGDWQAGAAFVVIQATIANRGSPSIATDYEIYIHKGAAKTRYKPHVFDRRNPINVESSEALFEKTEAPIQKGARVRGFLWTTIPGITHAQYQSEGCYVEIEFKDINGAVYSCKQDSAGSRSSEGAEIFPGTGNPIGEAFKKARQPAIRESDAAKEKRRRNDFANRLASIMDNGRALADRFFTEGETAPSDDEIDEWFASAYVEFASKPTAAVYVARFNAANEMIRQLPTEGSQALAKNYNQVMSKVRVLEQFIKELTSLS